jgi:MFS family permease
MVFSALTFALSPLAVLLAPYVVTTLHISTGWIGLIQAGDTIGNILGGMALALAPQRVKPRALIIVGMFMLAALIASIAVATTVASLLVAYFVFGLLTVAIQTGIGALTQTEVDNAMMGRFIGLMSIAPSTVSVLAMAFCGTLGAVLGIRNIFLISGALLAVSTILAWRQFQRATQLPGEAQ